MDEALLEVVRSLAGLGSTGKEEGEVEMLLDLEHATVTIRSAEGERSHALKPLTALYGSGINAMTIEPVSPEYMPLFLAIEERFAEGARHFPNLRDSEVSSALDRMAINPEINFGENGLVEALQMDLRLVLSLNDYSRRDVQRALRKIGKSVERHTRQGGQRGYLTFIRDALRR